MEAITKERIFLWDNIKVILMMLVVITHSVNIYQLEGERWIQFLWVFIMTFTMPAFMMVSGFWYKPRSFKYSCKSYLYPCVIFSIINFIVGSYSGAYTPPIFIEVWPTKSAWAMWYIWALFIYAIVTPILLKKLGVSKLLFASIMISFFAGIYCIPDRILDCERVINFYPFFIFGQWIKQRREKSFYKTTANNRIIALFVFITCIAIYLIATYYYPGYCYATGFRGCYGLHPIPTMIKWSNFFLTLIMSYSLLYIVPNKNLLITKYGQRTMNVYLLHMSIIFIMSWGVCKPIMYEWFSYLCCLIITPIICCSLFSEKVDRFMKPILDFPNKLFRYNDK